MIGSNTKRKRFGHFHSQYVAREIGSKFNRKEREVVVDDANEMVEDVILVVA